MRGFLRLRDELRRHGLRDGFQWVDGSFLEEVEKTENRAPGHIDVVTFYWSSDPDFTLNLMAVFPIIADHDAIKATYFVDHFPIDAAYHPETTIEATRYWCGLFSHTRSGIWKWMLKIDLNTLADDAAATALLATKP